MEKTCCKCKITKPFSMFYWDKKRSTYLYICRKCDNIKNNQNKVKRGFYKNKHPRFLAMRAVHQAVKNGKLKKTLCKVCKDPKVQGHHYKGYNKENVLKVIWLCQLHHNLIHHPSSLT